jgi:hypothetical protein
MAIGMSSATALSWSSARAHAGHDLVVESMMTGFSAAKIPTFPTNSSLVAVADQ